LANDVIKEDRLNYILVEGPDDAQVLFHLLQHYGLHTQITIQKKDGINNLLESLEVELKRRAETLLCIILDTDTDIATRWQSLRHKLIEAGYHSVPPQPDSRGTILKQEGHPTVGLWLMPNNIIPGTLEDFMSLLIPDGDILWPIAQDIVQQVVVKDRRFPQTQTMKANIHTWLAWQEEPGKPMGQAITKRYFRADATHAQQLIVWMKKLFNLEATSR
jgi:hypothetical protein